MQKGEGQARPTIWPAWMGCVAILGDLKACKPHDDCLPNCTTACLMDALESIASPVFKINQHPLLEKLIVHIELFQFARENDMLCRCQRGPIIMVGDGIVVVPVHSLHLGIKLLAEQGDEREDIGLLDDAVTLRRL